MEFSERSTFLVSKQISYFSVIVFWWMKICSIILAQNWWEIILCFALCNFFVPPPPCTPIFTVLYPASHKLVLCFCDTVILVLCWYEPATSQNLLSSQYCKQMESTMFRARQFVCCTVYSLQCTVLQYTIQKSIYHHRLNPWLAEYLPACSLNWLISFVSHDLKQVKSVLSGCV